MKHYHKNPRQITKKQFADLQDSLRRLGDLSGIVHDLNSDEIIGGNMRMDVFDIKSAQIELTEKLDQPDEQGTVARGYVIWQDKKYTYRAVMWDDKTREEANIRANKAGGSWDFDTLANEFEANDLVEWGFSPEELGIEVERETKDAEPQIDRAAELNEKWQVKTGDLWQIGEHRLLCGDSTKREDVERVMGGEKAELAPVDPPYNVGFDYDGSTVDDTKSAEIYETFSRAWFGECQNASINQIVTPGCNNLASWLRWFDAYHWAPWTKSNSMTNGKVSRFWCWEPVLFFGEKWKRSRPNDLFEFPIGMQKDVANHPCPKPLKMWVDLIENYSDSEAIIFESFGGSGTTIVASEQTKRKCRAIEISPNYCAVILERMATAFPELTIERIE